MQIEHLYDLLEVVRLGSINKASGHLHMQQQNLSRLIKHFEEEINIVLFNRTSKGLTLTRQGEQVIARLEQITALYDEILQLGSEAAPLVEQTLLYYTTADIWATTMYQLLDEFTKHYPQIVIAVEECSAEFIPEQLRQAKQAAAKTLLIDNGVKTNFQMEPDQELCNTYSMRPVIYAYKDSIFAQRYKSSSLRALLRQQQEIAVYKPYAKGKTVAESIFDGIGIPNIRYYCSNAQGFYNLLRSGDCIAVGCLGPFNVPDRSDIVIIPIRDKVAITAGTLINKADRNVPLISTFITFVEHFLAHYLQK